MAGAAIMAGFSTALELTQDYARTDTGETLRFDVFLVLTNGFGGGFSRLL